MEGRYDRACSPALGADAHHHPEDGVHLVAGGLRGRYREPSGDDGGRDQGLLPAQLVGHEAEPEAAEGEAQHVEGVEGRHPDLLVTE